MSVGKFVIFSIILMIIFSGCATPFSIAIKPTQYSNKFIQADCGDYLKSQLEIAKSYDTIYTAINSASIARICQDFTLSNELLDLAEDSYKYDVDLENISTKALRLTAGILLNESFADYDGNLYERIMVNVYKGLNFMSLGDFANARIEFNRALIRQDMAKEYFAAQIAAAKEELEKNRKNDPYYKQNLQNSKIVYDEYSHFLNEFKTSEVFTNPYATYIAAVFYYLDKDYKNSADTFAKISIANPKNKQFARINQILQNRANQTKNDKKRYIFLAYEDGLGTIKDEFSLNIPYLLNGGVATLNLSLPRLKKRDYSYKNININGINSTKVSDFDDIFATEFKIELPFIITKSILSMALKSTATAVMADKVGGNASLLAALLISATNKADTRAWQTLPKSANIAMVDNNGKFEIKDNSGKILVKGELDKSKDALIWLRSAAKDRPITTIIIQR